MSTNRLQNSKYQSCIDACNACAESCKLCATSCLREEDVKMLSRCIQLDRDCATICWTASTYGQRQRICVWNKSAISVRSYVMPVPKNVRDINIWNTVNCAHRRVESAPKNVIKWQDKKKLFISCNLFLAILLTGSSKLPSFYCSCLVRYLINGWIQYWETRFKFHIILKKYLKKPIEFATR